MEQEQEYYTWQEFARDVEKMTAMLESKGLISTFKNVYGFPRGGLILAVCISHRLGIPLILDREQITEKTLIVDDIADTGKTLYPLKIHYLLSSLKPIIITLFYHRQSLFAPDIWLREKKDKWIHFPWEA